MKTIFLFSIAIWMSLPGFSQASIDNILSEIEKNNTTLQYWRKITEADKIGNKTGIYLPDMEAEFNYLFGSPSSIGDRTDINLRQNFDFPTAYSYRKQIAGLRNGQADLEYQKQRMVILGNARIVCAKLAYRNARQRELSERIAHAAGIVRTEDMKFGAGAANALDLNKARVNLLNLTKESETNEIERKALLNELSLLNGGITTDLVDKILIPAAIPVDFDQWYATVEQKNPVLQWLKQEVSISHKQEQLNSSLSLPKFSAGYMSEKVVGQHYQGITAGISIPLWENKNTVKYARAKADAVKSAEADVKVQFYSEMKTLHARAVDLLKSLNEYRKNLQAFDNRELLKKALEKGEISLSDYFYELSFYYQSTDKILEMEFNLNEATAELNKYNF